tara:strand:- start:318 stop:761 length:444 start_codon:yes stop_codon:yes gene_type:complete
MNNSEKYNLKTVLCIDYGTKNIGLSLFKIGIDPFPMPFCQIINQSEDIVINKIIRIIDDELVDLLVLGLPQHKDGNDSEMTKLVRAFKQSLESANSPEVQFQNEFLTSFEAEERMKTSPRYNFKIDKSQIDSLAASIILEEWLKSTP